MLEKYRKKADSILLLLMFFIFLVATFYLFYGGPDGHASRSTKELWNLGHVIYFAIFTCLLARYNPVSKLTLPQQWVFVLVITLLLGVLIEFLQYGTDRSPDLDDVSRDLVGSLLVLAFHPAFFKVKNLAASFFLRLLVVSVLLFHLMPLMIAWLDEYTARSQFPVLSNFETAFELDRWDGIASKEIVEAESKTGGHLLKIRLMTTAFTGVGMKYLPPDWRGYKSVNLRIYKPSEKPLSIVIRVHDIWHETGAAAFAHEDRFNRRVDLNRGWNDIRIPLSVIESAPYNRKMDLSRISNIRLFASRLSEPRIIYLDEVYLSK